MVARTLNAVAGPNPWLDIYGLVSIAKLRFFSPGMRQTMAEHVPYADLVADSLAFQRITARATAG